MADKKTEMQKLAEKILIKRKPAAKTYKSKDTDKFADEYKDFLSNNKTEREVIEFCRETAEKNGFKNIKKVKKLDKGGKYYRVDNNKNLALIIYNGLDGINAVASHADSPCLHLKPYPLDESQKLALFKTHYYGGVKKYQWMNIPLSLRGVAFTQKGKKIEFSLGDKEGDTCFTIPDLLPHLAQEQMKKEGNKIVDAEQLNALVGNLPVDDEKIKDKAKLAVAKILHDEYGLVEEDLVSSELSFVPAGNARDVGFDRSMVTGYGQDDRSSVYTSLRAILEAKKGSRTQMCLFYDKEEIGSYGKTGAQNFFFTSLIEDLIELSGKKVRPLQVWEKTKVLSADVTAAIDPNFSDTHDKTNSSFIGYGVAVEKFGGSRGKYSTNDADAEFIHSLIQTLNKKKVPWQTGELGKVDLGGGGTIAMFLAKHGADVIDVGIPVLGMHAPFELSSKADLYSAYNAYKVFLENEV